MKSSPYILIIGGNSDIVKALLPFYAKEKYNFLLTGRNIQALEKQAQILEKNYAVKTQVKYLDITEMDLHASFCHALATMPQGIICGCGYLGEVVDPTVTKEENIHAILSTNYIGPVRFIETFLAEKEQRQDKSFSFLLGISSVAGDRGKQSNYLYGSAKSGFSTYLSGLRQKLHKQNIFVLNAKPGYVISPMIAHKQNTIPSFLLATPYEVSSAIFQAHKRKQAVIYTPYYWKWISRLFSILPDFIFKRLTL